MKQIRSRMTPPSNIFTLPVSTDAAPAEVFETLHEQSGVKIERIISHSAASPEGFWYDQDLDEWVIVLQGDATLQIHPDRTVHLKTGDHLFLPAHQKHRVARTSALTLWLAVHITRPTQIS